MEHEVYVPFSVASVKAALAEPERVARCAPGLQLDAGEGADSGTGRRQGRRDTSVAGRLRMRIGGSTITYRGSLRFTPEGDGLAVSGSGSEARGSGSAELELTLVPRLSQDGEGTRLVISGTARADGRLAEFEEKVATAAARRLLDRFTAAFTGSIGETDSGPAPTGTADGAAGGSAPEAVRPVGGAPKSAAGIGDPDDNERAIPGIPGPESGDADSTGKDSEDKGPAGEDEGSTESSEKGSPAGAAPDGEGAGPDSGAGKGAGDGAEVAADEQSRTTDTPHSPEDEAAQGRESNMDESEHTDEENEQKSGPEAESPGSGVSSSGVFGTEVPPSSFDEMEDDDTDRATAEAAHARRTMIGRSAEEVDHAPPRGRYSPVPTPEPNDAAATLRWAAPAAAVVVAGAVVLGRALRRRR